MVSVNNIQLALGKTVTNLFCVGQKLVFDLGFVPPLEAGTASDEKHEWWLPAKYVNAKEDVQLFLLRV